LKKKPELFKFDMPYFDMLTRTLCGSCSIQPCHHISSAKKIGCAKEEGRPEANLKKDVDGFGECFKYAPLALFCAQEVR
jgi:hypothetical protein